MCEAADRIVGFTDLSIAGAVAEVRFLFIDPEYMGQGHGRALWRHLVASARGRGIKALVVDSDPNAEGFYRAMGCRRAGESPSASIPGRALRRLDLDLEA